jgi:hypothetical protein
VSPSEGATWLEGGGGFLQARGDVFELVVEVGAFVELRLHGKLAYSRGRYYGESSAGLPATFSLKEKVVSHDCVPDLPANVKTSGMDLR